MVDSDGTLILYDRALSDGTRLTRDLCKLLRRPCILISARDISAPTAAAQAVLEFIEDNRIQSLNVAGPRASGWTDGYAFALAVMAQVIERAAIAA